jgi:hypothetical protein
MEEKDVAGIDEESVEYSNPFSRLIDVIVAPEDAFGSLRRKPTWFVSALICILIGLGASVFIVDQVVEIAREQTLEYLEEHRAELSPEQIEMIEAQAEQTGEGPMFYVFFFIGGLARVLLYLVVVAAALNIASGVAGRKLGFKGGLGIVSLGLVTYAVGAIVGVVLLRLTGDINAGTNLGVLFPARPTEWWMIALKSLATRIDIFAIWTVYLYTVGLSELTGISRKRSFRLVLVLWALWALAMVGLSFLFGG